MAWVGDGFALIDAKCVDLVELFNQIGLKTEFSCCGHRRCVFQIIFNQSVEDSDIYGLINNISAGRYQTPLMGVFMKLVRYVNGSMQSNWVYQINEHPYQCAKIDYEFLSKFYNVAYAEENQ